MSLKIISTETTEYQLLHPATGEPLFLLDAKTEEPLENKPMIAEIYGKHTSKFKNAVAAISREISQSKAKGAKELTADQITERTKQAIRECVAGFKNVDIETENGVIDGTDVEKAMSIWWIEDQITNAISDTENFIK